MSRVRKHCRCCFSSEALETLQSLLLDVYKIICLPQGAKTVESPIEICFKCYNFLKDICRFRRKCQAVDEIFKNNLQHVKDEVEMRLERIDVDIFDDVCVKNELTCKEEEIDMHFTKIETDSESERSRDDCDPFPEVPFVAIDDIYAGYSQEETDPIKDDPSIDTDSDKDAKSKIKTKRKQTKPKKSKKRIDGDKIKGGIVKRKRKPYKHFTDKPYACEECSYACNRPSALQEHQRTHTGERPFCCDLCAYTSASKSALRIHMKNKHTNERPYACDVCEYRAKNKSAFLVHKKIHLNIRDFVCNLCPYRSVTLCGLENHIKRAHTGEKPFACHLCPFRTTTRAILNSHLMIHNEHKKYSCNDCSYASNDKFCLQNHIRTHTGEKPYKCDVCSSRYINLSSLKRHQKNFHGITNHDKKVPLS